jgi:hypothetical protein
MLRDAWALARRRIAIAFSAIGLGLFASIFRNLAGSPGAKTFTIGRETARHAVRTCLIHARTPQTPADANSATDCQHPMR